MNNNKFYFGIDIGGTSIKFGLFVKNNANTKLLTQFSIPTTFRKKNAEKELTNDIFNAIDNFINTNKFGLNKNNIFGIGYAIPGPVVKNKILKAVNINWNKDYDLEKITKIKYGRNLNVKILNDANAAAIGEYNFSLKSKYNSICLLTLGTAVGVGIIIHKQIVEGNSGIAGELSHIKVDFTKNALNCNCGNTGCLETVTGGKGIENIYNRLYSSKNHKNCKKIFDDAKNGNKKAIKALNVSFDYLSYIISILMHVYEPEVIIIGGGVSKNGKIVTDIIIKHLREKVFITKKFPKICLARLKNKAGMYGIVADL